MATIKSFTSLEQSKKLAEILPIESADMYYLAKPDDTNSNMVASDICIPRRSENDGQAFGEACAWSLSALLNVLPRFIEFKDDKYYLRFMKEYVEYANDEISITGRCLHTTGNDNLVDACYEMIIRLNELKML